MVGRGAGVAAGSEAVQDPKGGEDAQPVLGGVQLVEGDLGELVAGEDPMVGQQPAQLPITWGESSGQVSQPAGLTVGAGPDFTTSGCRHLITARESATWASAPMPP